LLTGVVPETPELNSLDFFSMNGEMRAIARLFDAALDSEDAVRQPAEQEILEAFRSDVRALLLNCAAIVMSDADLPHRAHLYSFVVFTRTLCPNPANPLATLEQNWISHLSDDDRLAIKTAILRGLMFPSEDIWRQAAHCVSLVVHLERRVNAGVFASLQRLLVSAEYDESVHFAAIRAIREVYEHRTVSDMPNDVVDSILREHVAFFYSVLKDPTVYPVPFVNEVVLTLAELIRERSEPFAHEAEQTRLFDLVERLLPFVRDEQLYGSLHSLFWADVQVFYGAETLPIHRIMAITVVGIRHESLEFSLTSLGFWNTLVRKEITFDRINNGRDMYEEAGRSHLTKKQIVEGNADFYPACPWARVNLARYSSLFARRHMDVLLATLFRVDPANTSVEDTTT
jgi:hypothetical protein